MKIEEFLEQCAGNWFSQRTSYHLNKTQVDNSKSDLTIERLSQDNSEIISLCQQYQINPSDTLGGTKTRWDNSADWGKPKQNGFAIVVFIPDRDNSSVGKILQTAATPAKTAAMGRYVLGNDEALTLILEAEKNYLEERIWFGSPNVRLRTSLAKNANSFSRTVFYSEIRKIPPKSTS
jgi:phycoerythrin-associated linker protein